MKTAIRQHDISDCAAACIASVARHYGEDIPLTLIRETSGTSQAGTSIKGILDAAQAIGFRATGYKSDEKALDKLQDLKEPVILHIINDRGDLHFVVLYALNSRHARVMDPSRGKIIRMDAARLRDRLLELGAPIQFAAETPAPYGKKRRKSTGRRGKRGK